jgi:hypothetical protein
LLSKITLVAPVSLTIWASSSTLPAPIWYRESGVRVCSNVPTMV